MYHILKCIIYYIISWILHSRTISKLVETDKPKLKVENRDAVGIRWLCPEKTSWKPHFELTAKGVFRLWRCYIFRQGVPGLWVSNWKAWLPKADRLTGGTRRQLVPVERSDHLLGRLRSNTSGPRYGGALWWRTLNVSRAMLYSICSEMCNQ